MLKELQLAGSTLRHYHVAVLVRCLEEEYEVLGSFIKEGIDAGEKSVHICDPKEKRDHLRHLEHLGIPLADCARAGQLEVLGWEDAYLRSGRFDCETMKALLSEVVRTTLSEGFPRVRLYGHMEWSLEDHPGGHQLIEFESRVDSLLNELQQPGLCIYDVTRFNGATILGVLKTHRFVLMDGKLLESPLYTPPERFLREWTPPAQHGCAR